MKALLRGNYKTRGYYLKFPYVIESAFPSTSNPQPMIHLKRNRAFGDVLWTEPIVRHLIDQGNLVNVITCYPEVFENYPSKYLSVNHSSFHDNQINSWEKCWQLSQSTIDLNMAYEKNPKMHLLAAYQIASGIEEMQLSYPQLHLKEQEKHPLFPHPYVTLHIEKNPYDFRNVYGIDWKKIVQYLQDLGLAVLQISQSGEDIYGQWIKTENWRKLMSLIYHSRFFIGLDSGPSHIAAVFDIPALIFFGSVNPAFRHLSSFKGIFLQQPCPHAHCYHEVVSIHGQTCRLVGKKDELTCCMQTTDQVIEAIDKLYV
jgi:hypothetical protein